MNEIELQILFDELSPRELWARAKASKLTNGGPKTRMLRSLYLDTSEQVLRKAGIELRLRRDGRRWTQTVKTNAELHSGLSQVDEVENAAVGGRLCLEAIPDARVREEVVCRVNGAPLRPVCEIAVERSTSEVTLEDGTRAELALMSAKSTPMGALPNWVKSRSHSLRAAWADCSALLTFFFLTGA